MSDETITSPPKKGSDAPAISSTPEWEWWERLALRWRSWRHDHDDIVRRLAVARAVVTWSAIPILAVVVIRRPELRTGLWSYLGVVVLVAVWFVLARTKTVSWRLVSSVFALGAPLAFGIAWLSALAASWAGLPTVAYGAGVGIASFLEEAFKLAPLLVLAVVAPGRVRRFAAADWAVLVSPAAPRSKPSSQRPVR